MCCNSFFEDGTRGVQFNLHMGLCVCLYARLFLKEKKKNQNIQLLTDPSVSLFRRIVIYAWLYMERCRGNDHPANYKQLIGDLGQT